MAVVSINRCRDYEDFSIVCKAVRDCLRQLGDLTDLFHPHSRVLLKPNLLSSRRGPEEPCNTHPQIVRALTVVLQQDYNCRRIFLGDSSGGLSYGRTKQAFAAGGYDRLAEELGVELVDFDKISQREVKNEQAAILKSVKVTGFLQNVDAVISLPKLKTHSLVGFTGAMKNMMGLVPGSGKRRMHALAPRPEQMSRCFVELFAVVKPHLSLMDAVVAMAGDGPAAGEPVAAGLLLASRDAVALDAVAAAVAGFGPGEVASIRFAGQKKLGEADLRKIEIRGEQPATVKLEGFSKPTIGIRNKILDWLPGFFLRHLIEGMTMGRPVIDSRKCSACYACLAACPAAALSHAPSKSPVINYRKCVECYCCQELCPDNAISIKMPTFIRLVKLAEAAAKKIFYIGGRVFCCSRKIIG